MTDQPQGPIYEYMMGTFDLHEATWLQSMNDMLNNFGLAGWKRSVVTLLDARHLLVVMERRFPSAAEYEATKAPEVRRRELAPDAAEEVAAVTAKYRDLTGREAAVDNLRAAQPALEDLAEADEYDDEAEAMMAAKVAEVIPWAARPKVPANGRRKGAKGPQRKKVQLQPRNKAAT